MSPDMLPYVGSDVKVKNLFISCGHGPNGWTTSSGTGRFLTQVVFQNVSESRCSQPIRKPVPRINLKTFLSWLRVKWMRTKRKFTICLIQTDLIKYLFDNLSMLEKCWGYFFFLFLIVRFEIILRYGYFRSMFWKKDMTWILSVNESTTSS